MASRVILKRGYRMLKILSLVILLGVFFASHQTILCQTKDEVPEFYQMDFLRSDFKQVSAVVYVNVKSRELVDQIGQGGCEQNTGTGYCLYRLNAEVKEVFKGKVRKGDFQFYTTTDADYQNKDSLLGEKVVFLNWSDNYPDQKMSLGTLENSTRSIEYNVLAKIRKIAKEKSNRKN